MKWLITRYQKLLPAVEITISRTSVVVRCHDYKEVVEKQVQWLTETEEKVRNDVPLDNLDAVRVLLEEQEVSCLNACKYHIVGNLFFDVQNSEYISDTRDALSANVAILDAYK